MCGLLFVDQVLPHSISVEHFNSILNRQSWRGPDSLNTTIEDGGRFILGHNRLSIIDPCIRSNQPMRSQCGRYTIIFNGEIYNHIHLRSSIPCSFRTTSDTETLVQGFAHEGENFFKKIEGMFSFIILDNQLKTWVAARDPFGIKPLFFHRKSGFTAICSESASLALLINASPCATSIDEWRVIRRPMPGTSYFKEIGEVSPGSILRSNGTTSQYWFREASSDAFNKDQFEFILRESVLAHEISDVKNVSLLSGGLDSAVITALSKVKNVYTVGLEENNEFDQTEETANLLNRDLIKKVVTPEEMIDSWKFLVRLRGEPLSVPNEALIYQVCKAMKSDEKVVLTGEGADELLFGYDHIYRWAMKNQWTGVFDFLKMYGYSSEAVKSDRLIQYIENLRSNKSVIEFVEDFFYDVHLPGLLRRMDFASMAASKEARVPFVCKSLVNYMYRRPASLKLSETESKLPLRRVARDLGLKKILARKKIGFSAQFGGCSTKQSEYAFFQNLVLKELGW